MALTTAQAFDEFKRRLLLTDNQRDDVKSRRKTSHGYLLGAFPGSSDMPLVKTSLIGSAKRGTIIRPLDDIDVLAVFGEDTGAWTKYRSDSQKFLYRVREALTKYRVEVVGARGQAVRLFYKSPPHVDIAPVFVNDHGGFLLPSGDGKWIHTHPLYADEWIDERDEQLDRRLKPFVRLLRRWNREHSRYFKAFHLEVMAANLAEIGDDPRKALHKFSKDARINVKDPFTGRSLSDYMGSWSSRRSSAVDALASAKRHAKAALNAERLDNHAEAKRQWRIILGDEFPT